MSSTRLGIDSLSENELVLREQLSSLRGLLALSMLMTDRRHEDEIILLVTSAVPALVRARPVGVRLTARDAVRWYATTGAFDAAVVRAEVAAQLRGLPVTGGALTVTGLPWVWALTLRSQDERIGHLVVAADEPPSPDDMLLLRSLAQQTGIALANARLLSSHQQANDDLARTVATLRHQTAIHDRFTQVALTGGGRAGIVTALYELTGLAASIENRAGDVLAWAGPDADVPPHSELPGRRDRIVQRAIRAGHPIRIDGRLLTVARPRSDVVGVLSLIDPDGVAGEQETVAVEHAATVLAIELARLHSLAETELRLGRDLVADLVAGTDAQAHERAQALGHDLRRPHRVLVIQGGRRSSPDELVLRVREALTGARARREEPPPLLMQTAQTVVALVAEVPGAEDLGEVLVRALGPGHLIGVGGRCREPRDFARSHREALLAQRLGTLGGRTGGVRRHDDLGVFQLLADAADPVVLETFVRRWLGPLLDYDARRGADLVVTLARFLECGGNYDATASELALGRSTVRYRLRRIRELSGLDLADPDTRFNLQLATRAWATRRALAE